MSLDDLFTLLLFALFLGLPLLSRLFRRGPTPPGKSSPPTRTGVPSTPPTAPKRDIQSAPGNAADDIAERLEQARRRVREAVEGQTARVDTRPAGDRTGLESAGDMFRPRQEPPARVPATPPVREVTAAFLPPDAVTARRSARISTRPLQVERSLRGKRAKLNAEMLAFSREDIMRGMIWKQILDEPKSKRPWRNPSQHP